MAEFKVGRSMGKSDTSILDKEFNLSEKLTIEGFRSGEWFNENIWEDDLDKNEIVELVLKEVSKDIKQFIKKLKEEFVIGAYDKKYIKIKIDKLAGKKLI